MMRNWLLIIFGILGYTILFAQNNIPVGSWRTHNSYNSLVDLTNNKEQIIAATKNALFTFAPATQDLDIITSISGLNDTDIATVDFNEEVNKLVISYRNGNIDILQGNQITNFPELLNANISGSKEVYHIYNYLQYSYLSADFGVMIIDLEKMQIKETLFELGPQGQRLKIFASTIASDTLFLATEMGVMKGSLKDNLKDFNQWIFIGPANGLPNATSRVILTTPSGVLTAIDNTGIFTYDGGTWQNIALMPQVEFLDGNQSNEVSLITSKDSVYQYITGNSTPINTPLSKQPQASLNFAGETWVADGQNGLIAITANKAIYPNGPYSNDIAGLFINSKSVIAVPPAYDNFLQPLRNDAGYFSFSDGLWTNYNSTGNPQTILIPEFLDVTGSSYSKTDEALYLSSFGYGILKVSADKMEIIDENTPGSTLINSDPSGRNVLVPALDGVGSELAILNFATTKSLHLLDVSENSWQSFTPGAPSYRAIQVINMGNGTYWLRIAPSSGGGIKIYDTINQRELFLTADDDTGGLPNNKVYDMALDREGKMWVATEKGVIYYYNAAFILDNGIPDPVFPVFEGQILFKDDKVSALAIDGGNRVWMSTTSGLWLFSGDGQTVVSHFEAEDSPLPTNEILDIAIDQSSGEVFIATGNGLVSYRGSATSIGLQEDVKIFPNPVITSRDDIITFEGVPENADLTITDSSGRMVIKIQANGNTAIWQGLSSNQSLSAGVYFVFVANDDGSQKQVGKLAIIN